MPIHKDLNHNFFKEWTPEMAYVLGFFAADGTMIKNNRGAHFIEFHITDRIVLSRIRDVLGSNHKISLRPKKKSTHRLGYRLQIGSKKMYADLSVLGFTPNKSKSVTFPAVPVSLVGDFVRGYFDGDGCVYFKLHKVGDRKKPRWIFTTRFTSGCKQFLVDLLSVLRSMKLQKGFITSKNGSYDLVFSHKDSVALCYLMYNNVSRNLFLPRKFRRFRKALRILFGKKVKMRL
ncbi:MAG: hypothetical protein A2W52_02200 [Candidatus Taylorbacteria bacterium RIFCSPHIGHO2_02_49_25]|uniref:DOD-type homing endonuclease domain-containing protein n=1 Tax=Candidatus Taylorbacteria bacterium RIFCSPHIGHO2_02_49_25 TaxID=1802305 RepID=A0A1G2MFD4_9BACT|nr:MAG: hypothetical protein A2759_04085 [Candidatus Taylorbacteria bacterium RIFCSPHIGHO2_01_FULL_49_60]OHA21751.1 MAG: hypothetical protein A2W52_02200 [Candidatus Taylorbacteria bacterium RIFCSPHIGHO2_02_49_25]OHA35449.1 MAG: hypothetical protein A2W65_00315 [Candidatus Taylorbacteria bacterium RIFCSPLOWO2_02_50_13]OHA36186.1 MAG: hypothetical protein A3B27_03245 [Candidatus Taylorbacteria bacterium RIFCSPLOWO2_01_FULL_50_130]OHA41924.1 MAG: hypothetical protein A3H73_01465 [Candidatus Taylo